MDVALYGRALWTYKWLALAGVVVAAAAALLSGYRLSGGAIESRATTSYTASTTVLLTSNDSSVFSAESPVQALPAGQLAPQRHDLAATAVIYAYLVSGDKIRSETAGRIGGFASGEALTALQRTTQPPASEASAGRMSLPIVSVVGTAATAGRAEQISRTATAMLETYVAGQQDTAKVPAAQRVVLATLNTGSAVAAAGSNPLLGVVVVGAGVLAAFVALIFVLYNIRMRREEAGTDTTSRAGHERIDLDRDGAGEAAVSRSNVGGDVA